MDPMSRFGITFAGEWDTSMVSFKAKFGDESLIGIERPTSKSDLRPDTVYNVDERKFYETLQESMADGGDGGFETVCFASSTEATKIAFLYSDICATKLTDFDQLIHHKEVQIGSGFGASTDALIIQKLKKESDEIRAERDFWVLLGSLMRANLLKRLHNDECETAARNALTKLSPDDDCRTAMLETIVADERVKKTKELKEWLERCAEDRVQILPPTNRGGGGGASFPGSHTLSRILDGRPTQAPKGISSLHPDAQAPLKAARVILSLQGTDAFDQESLWRSVWQLIRSGQLAKAQELAASHRYYWLAACLLGAAESHDSRDESETAAGEGEEGSGGSGVSRKHDNTRRALWLEQCWNHAENLMQGQALVHTLGPAGREVSSEVTQLEAAIFGALCGHSSCMKALTSGCWADKTWASLKTLIEYQLANVVASHLETKAAASALYPECHDKDLLLSTWETVVGRLKTSVNSLHSTVLDDTTTGETEVDTVLRRLYPKSSGPIGCLEEILLQLQCATMISPAELRQWISSTCRTIKSLDESGTCPVRGSFDHSSKGRLLRITVHLLLWITHTSGIFREPEMEIGGHPDDRQTSLTSLVPYASLREVIGAYMRHLCGATVKERHEATSNSDCQTSRSLVPVYLVYLHREDRIKDFVETLNSFDEFAPDLSESARLQWWRFSKSQDNQRERGGRERQVWSSADGQEREEVLVAAVRLFPHDVIPTLTLLLRTKRKELRQTLSQEPASSTEWGSMQENILMNSIRWLCIFPEHRLEAIRQCSFFAREIFLCTSWKPLEGLTLESESVASLRKLQNRLAYLLNSALPIDSAEVCDGWLREYYSRQEGNEGGGGYLEKQYQLALSELLLWRYFERVLQEWLKWVEALQCLLRERQSSLGSQQLSELYTYDHKKKLEKTARLTLDSVLRTILFSINETTPSEFNMEYTFNPHNSSSCDPEQLFIKDVPGGISAVFKSSDSNLRDNVERIMNPLEELGVVLPRRSNQSSRRTNTESSSVITKLKHLLVLTEEVNTQLLNMYSTIGDPVLMQSDFEDLIWQLQSSENVLQRLAGLLLLLYLQVCQQTAVTFSPQTKDSISKENQASTSAEFFQRAVELANVVADRDEALSLRDVVDRSTLVSVLAGVQSSALSLINLKGGVLEFDKM